MSVTGLDEIVEEFRAELRALHDKIDALALSNGHSAGWFRTKGAAVYLDTTEVAIRSLVFDGKLEASYNGSNKLMFQKAELDRYAQSGRKPEPPKRRDGSSGR